MSNSIVLAPQYIGAFAVATNVSVDVTARSPALRSAARQARCRAAVPLVTAMAYFAPT